MTSAANIKQLPYLLPARRRSGILRPSQQSQTPLWGTLTLTLLVAMALGFASLTLANLTLRFQQERDALAQKTERLSQAINALDLEVARRQESAAIKTEAERLGLVATDKVLFYEKKAGQLTRQ